MNDEQPTHHEPWCSSINGLLATMPPRPAPCNCKAKWDASAPITLNDGRLAQYPDGRIGVGTFSAPAVVRKLAEAAKRAMNYAENVVMAEGVYFDHDDDLPFIESALAAAKETGI